MHIAFATPEYPTETSPDGGLANYLRKTACALVARGHDVSVLVLNAAETDGEDHGVRVHGVRRSGEADFPLIKGRLRHLGGGVRQRRNARRLARRLWAVHAVRPISVIQASSYAAPGLALVGNRRVPVVCRISSYTPMVRAAYGWPRTLAARLEDWMELRQVAGADAAFAPSALMANVFGRYLERVPRILRTPITLEPIVPDDTFYRAHLEGRRYLLFFGTLSRIKGVDLLADALPPVLRAHGDLCFVLVGRDDGLPSGERMHHYLRRRLGSLAARLEYYPAIRKAQLLPVIENAIGAVMPSRVDNYPNACLEAQLCGVPVIGTRRSSLDEMIEEGKTGLLADNGDAGSLAAAMNSFLRLTESERQAMGAHCREVTQRSVDEDRVGQLLAFYREVVGAFRPRRAP